MHHTRGYEPGEQLIAPAVFQQDDTETRVIKFTVSLSTKAYLNVPEPPRTRVPPKSLWKNLSPTPSTSSLRATTGPGHRLSSHTSTIKVSGTLSLVPRRSRPYLRRLRLRVPPAPSPPKVQRRNKRPQR